MRRFKEFTVLVGLQKDLDEYLNRLEEAEKRDHRKLGKEMDLFLHFREESRGSVFWHEKGLDLVFKINRSYESKAKIGWL